MLKALLAVLFAVAFTLPPMQPAARVDTLLRAARQAPATVAPTNAPILVPELFATADPCPTPPPWTDQATAERCWTRYPAPFGGTIVPECQVGYSALGDLLCYGYYVPSTPPAGACVMDWSLPVNDDNRRRLSDCFASSGASYVLCPPAGSGWYAYFGDPTYCGLITP